MDHLGKDITITNLRGKVVDIKCLWLGTHQLVRVVRCDKVRIEINREQMMYGLNTDNFSSQLNYAQYLTQHMIRVEDKLNDYFEANVGRKWVFEPEGLEPTKENPCICIALNLGSFRTDITEEDDRRVSSPKSIEHVAGVQSTYLRATQKRDDRPDKRDRTGRRRSVPVRTRGKTVAGRSELRVQGLLYGKSADTSDGAGVAMGDLLRARKPQFPWDTDSCVQDKWIRPMW